MGKRRHTVHSGTKALYKRNSKSREEDDRPQKTRPSTTTATNIKYSRESDEDEDDLDQPFLKFDDEKQDDGDIQVEGMTDVENVLDLGLDMSDSDDDENEDEDSIDDSEEEEEEDDDDDAPDLEYYSSLKDKIENVKNNVLDWGHKKKNYYHGDTADLELGQEMEDAELEEEAGREVLKARLQRMEEADFYLDEEEEEEKNVDSKSKQKRQEEAAAAEAILSVSSKRTNTKPLSTREKKRLLQKQHPELFPLMQHFRDNVIRPCVDETLVVQKALLQDKDTMQAVGTTPAGLQYLITKSMMRVSAALNVCQYLLIKADMADNKAKGSQDAHNPFQVNFITEDDDGIKSHPVIERLNHLNILLETLEESVESQVPDLKEQLDSLRKASYLMQHGAIDEDSEDGEIEEQDPSDDNPSGNDGLHNSNTPGNDDDDSEDSPSNRLQTTDSEAFRKGARTNEVELKRQIFNEARFSLRSHEDDMQIGNKRRKRNSQLDDSDYLYGDQEHENLNHVKAGKSLTSTLNTISQKMSGKKQKLVDPEAEDEDFEKALALMDQDLGSDDEKDEDINGMGEDYGDDEDLKDPAEEGFYSKIQQKSKEKKKMKIDRYAVAPKYPRLDEEIEGERPVGNAIMKNRGLKKHRPKVDRNPRVKKREQYRKAIIRRKGAVRDIRTGEGHKYGGEDTGIKSNLSRSRKLGVK